jgi:hypothetical protein
MSDLRLERLTIALRPRTPWEAVDLGVALVRRHAAAIWLPWILVTLPAVLVASAIGHALGAVWIGSLLVWWAKPVFDRVPLYVLSRAVFGAAPDWRETVREQRSWGWRALLGWMTWRRLHPGRALLLPVDLLERPERGRRAQRVRVLSRASGSHSVLLTLLCANVELLLGFALLMLGLMFVPIEFFSDSVRAMWDTLFDEPPAWAQLVLNLVAWLAMSIVEPFYVGAGFGLYLNRRTELEAWDIELAFRRLLARLAPTLGALLLALALPAFVPAAHAADAPALSSAEENPAHKEPTLREWFGDAYAEEGVEFEAAVTKAYQDPLLSPRRTIHVWEPRVPEPETDADMPVWLKALQAAFALVAKAGLWIVIAIVLVLVIANHRRWLSWVRDLGGNRTAPEQALVRDVAQPEQLPDDPTEVVRALLRAGDARAALALLYRAAVRRLSATLDRPLPAGATESECLHSARQLRADPARELFVQVVRCWQGAAYAGRRPAEAEVEALLAAWPAAWSTTP